MHSGIRCTLMRGGTYRGAYFLAEDLPLDIEERNDLRPRIMGSPDSRQIDGIGGTPPLMRSTRGNSHASILFVEDEEALQMTVGDRLRNEGYTVEYAANGDEAFEKAIRVGFDVLLLDVMLPGRDGFSVCRDIRRAGLITPILMLTARTPIKDKVSGLRIGADDYLTKPFDMQELIARIEALLRRAPIRQVVNEQPYHFGHVTVDLQGTDVTRHGERVCLSAREFQLLQYFIEHPGATLSREELLREVWGYRKGTFSRTVDVHVASLRQKLEGDSKQPRFILTVTGLGYKFTP